MIATTLKDNISFTKNYLGKISELFRTLLVMLGLFLPIFFTYAASTAASTQDRIGPFENTSSRIKDIAAIEGVRDNQLIGYGLVVGLNGTGDTLLNIPFTEQSLETMLERLGVNAKDQVMRTANVAAVMVIATLPSFSRVGTRIDVTVSSLGDANDLRGGTLLVTPLMAATGDVFAVAQGAVAVAGFNAGGDGAGITQGVPTTGRIANGAIVEAEPDFELSDLQQVNISLFNPDLTTARRMADAINDRTKTNLATALDPATIQVSRPVGHPKTMVQMLTEIEQLRITPDTRARVLIDERTGIIVMGADVRINPVAIALGTLTISVEENPQVSQPEPFSEGETVVTPDTDIVAEITGTEDLRLLRSTVSLQELVDGLNALGVNPQDLIAILQAVKAAGAMQAEIQVM